MYLQREEEYPWFAKTKGGEWAKSIWHGEEIKKGFPSDIRYAVYKKLVIIDAATNTTHLRRPPGNRLELLKGDRKGQYSIRVNDQWRICFVWKGGERPYVNSVEIVDYH